MAPLYALATAFLVSVGAGWAADRSAEAVLRVDAGQGVDIGELAGAVVEWLDSDGTREHAGTLTAQGTLSLPDAGGRTLCLRLPAPWRVTEPAVVGACTAHPLPDRPDADLRFAVARQGRVGVRFEGLANDQAAERRADLVVTLADPTDSAFAERGRLDGSGHYQPRRSLAGQLACVSTPPGWTVGSPETTERDGDRCAKAPIADPHGDFVFTMVKDGGGR